MHEINVKNVRTYGKCLALVSLPSLFHSASHQAKKNLVQSISLVNSTAQGYYIKKSRLEIQKRAFSRVGAKIWNEMPASLRELPKKHFQMKLQSFLLYS